jgi:hypothetical protein
MGESTEPQATTGETGTPGGASLRRRRGRRLYSLANVRAALGDVYRHVEAGTMPLDRARVLIYAASVLLGAIQGADIETRIAALEARGRP